MEPVLCKKPWLKAVDHNLAGGAASSRGLLYLLVPFLILKTDVFLLWHMGGTSLRSRDAGVCVQMGFSDMSLLLKLVCDTAQLVMSFPSSRGTRAVCLQALWLSKTHHGMLTLN